MGSGVGVEMSEEIKKKQPLLLEIIGEAEAGKTHTSLLFSNPALIDTTAKCEALSIVKKVFPEDYEERYFSVRSWQEILDAVKKIKEARFKTVVIDTAADLQEVAGEAWLKEVNGARKRAGKSEWKEIYPITNYKFVRMKVDAMIFEIVSPKKMCCNLIFIALMKDEWMKGKSTGRRKRDGYRRSNFQADLRLFLQLEKGVGEDLMPTGKYVRKCTVVKNRFVDKCSEEWKGEIETPLTFEKIMEVTLLKREEWVE